MNYSNEWLADRIADGGQLDYLYFWGHRPGKGGTVIQSCLSQWFYASFGHEGRHFYTAEHWMMWHKALTFDDQLVADEVLTTFDVKMVKALGRKVSNYDDATWAAARYEAVVKGNLLKFSQNPALKAYLLSTENKVIVEASPYDKIWGIGMTAEEARQVDGPAGWRGTNLLGYALMEVRGRL